MVNKTMPMPDINDLDPVGDFVLGRRLPEYRASIRANGMIHPMRFVGRKCWCEIHGNATTASMRVMPNKLPCSELAAAWSSSFEFGNIRPSDCPIIMDRPQLRAIRSAVVATIADEIAQTLHMPLGRIMLTGKIVIPGWKHGSMWLEWQRSPNRFADALDRGCSYEAWTQLKVLGLTHLARPGFVYNGQLGSISRALIMCFGDYAASVTQTWDRAASKVNVYTTATSLRLNQRSGIEYFGSLPITDDPAELASVIRAFARQYNMNRSGAVLLDLPNIGQSTTGRLDLMAYGLRGTFLESAVNAGLNEASLDRWFTQGHNICDNGMVARLEQKAQEHPDISDAFIAWWDAMHEQESLSINDYPVINGFGRLKPHRPLYLSSEELIAAESDSDSRIIRESAEEERDILASVVPADWWRSSIELLDNEMELEGSLSL